MKEIINVKADEPLIALTPEIVYKQRTQWCGCVEQPLRMSIMRPRRFFSYDPVPEKDPPVLLFFCGGGFTEMDRNIWIPELTYFAKHGYAVVSADYSVTARTRFPMQIEDAKAAVRFLRAHAQELRIDADRIAVMGESAGGYIAGLTAVTGNVRKYDVGDDLDRSSAVSGAVCFYSGESLPGVRAVDPTLVVTQPDRELYPKISSFAGSDTPPFLLLHGTADTQALIERSDALDEALTEKGVPVSYYIFEGAEHADLPFVQVRTKEIVLQFLDSILK